MAQPASDLETPIRQLAVRGSARKARALANTAVRETFEETGLLLGAKGDVGDSADETWQVMRRKGVAPNLSPLAYIGRAITSPYSPIRFHARFFLADGDQTFAIEFTATTSTDGDYSGLIPGNLPVTNVDDE